jgi:ribonuclease D
MSDVVLSRTSLRTADLPVYAGVAMADVVLVCSESLAREAFEVLMATDVIGFDTESKPTFRKGEVSTGPHLVQLATESRAYLFQVSRLHGNQMLKKILELPLVLKVCFGIGGDRNVLKQKLGIDVINVIDLGEVLRGPGHRGPVGVKVAVAHFFGSKLHKSKKTGTSNWSIPQLTERQLLYAANDAHVALKIFKAWVQAGAGAIISQAGSL